MRLLAAPASRGCPACPGCRAASPRRPRPRSPGDWSGTGRRPPGSDERYSIVRTAQYRQDSQYSTSFEQRRRPRVPTLNY
eukprot:759128-Prorocentrum_minimum.AAC.1